MKVRRQFFKAPVLAAAVIFVLITVIALTAEYMFDASPPRGLTSRPAPQTAPPIIINTQKLMATGIEPTPNTELMPFSPLTLTIEKLTATGVPPPPKPEIVPFTPVVITTGDR